MRAAIFASLIPAPDTEEERERLEDLVVTIVDWDQVTDGNSAKIRESQDFIRQAFPDGLPRLLDPFMGGGGTGLKALRLGCETHAVELNPAAHLIELCTLVYPQRCRNWRRGPSAPPAEVQRRDQCQPRSSRRQRPSDPS
jgi:putative DNA methylase